MNNFVKGVLLGVGVGLLVAPLRGEETLEDDWSTHRRTPWLSA